MANDNSEFQIKFKVQIENLKKQLEDAQKLASKFQKESSSKSQKVNKVQEKQQKSINKDNVAAIKLQVKEQNKLINQTKTLISLQEKLNKTNGVKPGGRGASSGWSRRGGGNWDVPPGQNPNQKQKFSQTTTGQAIGHFAGNMLTELFNFVKGGFSEAYQNYKQFTAAKGSLTGLDTTANIRAGRKNAGRGSRYGYNAVEGIEFQRQMAKATGYQDPRSLMAGTRATNMSAGELASSFGVLARGGLSFQPGEKGKDSKGILEFRKAIALGIKSGLKQGRMPEFFESVNSIAEQQQAMSGGVVGTEGISKILSFLGSQGGPGFQGARGGAIVTKLNNAFYNPGGGEAGKAFMLQAQGFGRPGGTTSYYDALKQSQRGLSDVNNLTKLMYESNAQFGKGQEGVIQLSELTGLSIDQAERLKAIYESNESVSKKMEDLQKISNEAKSFDQKIAESGEENLGMLKRIASIFDQSLGPGGMIAPAVHTIEDFMRKLFIEITKFIPPALKALQEIAEYLKKAFGESKDLIKKADQISKLPPKRQSEELAKLGGKLADDQMESGIFSSAVKSGLNYFNSSSKEREAAENIKRVAAAAKAKADFDRRMRGSGDSAYEKLLENRRGSTMNFTDANKAREFEEKYAQKYNITVNILQPDVRDQKTTQTVKNGKPTNPRR